MKILIIGAGQVGYMLSQHLMGLHDIVIVDKNKEAIDNINSQLDVLAIHGDSKNPLLYQDLDNNADILIAVTDSDETNILSALMIDEVLQVKKKIVRLRGEFFSSENLLKKLNISHAVSGIDETMHKVKRMLDNPYAGSIKTFTNSKLLFFSFSLQGAKEDIIVSEFAPDEYITICGLERDGEFFIPSENDVIKNGDYIYILGDSKTIEAIGKKYAKNHKDIETCIVFGANELGIKISQLLLKHDVNVRIYDKNIANCLEAQKRLGEDATIYQTKYGLDHDITKDDAQNIDLFISTYDEDEYNMAKSYEAKANGIPKVVCINNDIEYTHLLRNAGIDTIRGVKSSAFYAILERLEDSNLVFVRRFCGKKAIILVRQTYGLIASFMVKDFNEKIKPLGKFFILRGEMTIDIEEDTTVTNGDVIVCICKDEDGQVLKKWLEKQF